MSDHKRIPVIFDLDDTGEASGTVHFFCSVGCRSQSPYADAAFGYCGDYPTQTRCETCGGPVERPFTGTTLEPSREQPLPAPSTPNPHTGKIPADIDEWIADKIEGCQELIRAAQGGIEESDNIASHEDIEQIAYAEGAIEALSDLRNFMLDRS